MNNAPEDHEMFELPFGKNKFYFILLGLNIQMIKKYLTLVIIIKLGNFEIFLEDHTLGNLLKKYIINPSINPNKNINPIS
jgi:hypothetical protein